MPPRPHVGAIWRWIPTTDWWQRTSKPTGTTPSGALNSAQEGYERQSARAVPLADDDKARICALATDFPKLWSDPRTPQRERKRMVSLLVEDVTLARDAKQVAADVRFRADKTTRLEVTIGLSAYEIRRTPPDVVSAWKHR